ncbi:MAG TPA: hypothetical protein VII76_07660 [Acidimicrobiales bacterium]
MERLRQLGRGERIVLVVALGVALDAFCSYFVPLATFPFASTAQLSLPSSGPPGWFRVVVWIVLAGVWAWCSFVILRVPPSDPSDST